MKGKVHIIIIFSLVIIAAIALFGITRLLRPDSFDKYGHYRWNAVNEIISQKVVNQNTKTCSKCHDNIFQLHEKDAHYNVPCVDCHGAGDLHVAYHERSEQAKNITKEQARLNKEYNLEGCLFCHRKLKARPSDFPQIDKIEHFKFLHIKDMTIKCIECHSPHEPIFLLTDVKQSRLHPIVNKCTDCHNTKPEKSYKDVADHPKIFVCQDCHAKIVESFEKRPHNKYVECRTCHLFHKENESAGRMYKNGNAKFCLLCHSKAPFKDDKYPPKIDWPSHLGKKEYLVNIDQKICLNCHYNQIHEMDLKENPNPHAATWKKSHGGYVKQVLDIKNAKSTCGTCHQMEYCVSCHKVELPHSDSFTSGGHKEIVKQKGRKICATCHTKEQCTVCHE